MMRRQNWKRQRLMMMVLSRSHLSEPKFYGERNRLRFGFIIVGRWVALCLEREDAEVLRVSLW
jgi:hypothetical protein